MKPFLIFLAAIFSLSLACLCAYVLPTHPLAAVIAALGAAGFAVLWKRIGTWSF